MILEHAIGLLLLTVGAGPILFGLLHWCLTVRPPADDATGTVTLVLPLAPDTDIGPLRAALAAQTLSPRRLIVTMRDAPGDVVAGAATDRGQKSHNLLAALPLIDAADGAVVFLDADILPAPSWVAFLTGPILRGERDVVGGFRWSMPSGPAAQAVAWLDRGWAMTARAPGLNVAWGGSLAFSPACLPSIRRGLEHGLSDDLGIAAAARVGGLRLLIRGAALVPSPLASAGAVAFWVRQLQVLRFYRPGLWAAQMAASHLVIAAWLLLWGSWYLWLAVAALAARSLAQDVAARRLGMDDPPATRGCQAALGLLPLADLLNLYCLWSSALGRRMSWRGITYEVAPDGGARVVA
jgi:hypothetical protein